MAPFDHREGQVVFPEGWTFLDSSPVGIMLPIMEAITRAPDGSEGGGGVRSGH